VATHGLTFLEIINRVLSRLRKSTVAAHNSTDYSTMVGAMINAVKAEIEDAFQWNALRDTYDLNTVAGTTSYSLTGAGDSTILSVWNSTSYHELTRGTNREFDRNFFGSGTVPSGAPTKYLPAGLDASYELKLNIYTQQDDLAANDTVPLVPQPLLIEETIARLLVERGDEGAPRPMPGETFILRDMLAQTIAREVSHDPTEMDWEVE
jgi:hypothetical protein